MNWATLKSTVQQYLENSEATFVANLGLYARLAEEDIYRQAQLQVAKRLSTSATSIGDRFITPPLDTLSVYSLSVTEPVTGDYQLLLPKELAFMKECYPDPNERGMPRFYGWRDENSLMIAPNPDKVYVMEMHSFQKPVSISNNDDGTNETWLSKYGENALLFGMLYHGYINEKGDQDVITAYKGQFDKAVQDLKVIAEGRQRTDNYRIPA